MLNIVDSEYLTPGTVDTISRYCYNLEEFYFSMYFRVRDLKAWIDLLGRDLQHVVFTEDVNRNLETYYKIEGYYEDIEIENFD